MKPIRHEQIEEARDRGHRDHAAGVPFDHNPYLFETPENDAWKDGWLAERDAARGRIKTAGGPS